MLSDLYAMGVTECDNMLMLLAVSTKMTEKERDVVVPLMMRGFKDCAIEAGSTVTGGQTVMNPWCTIGGVATTVCQPNEFIIPDSAVVGDVLVLTKPLGTQVCSHLTEFVTLKHRFPASVFRVSFSFSLCITRRQKFYFLLKTLSRKTLSLQGNSLVFNRIMEMRHI